MKMAVDIVDQFMRLGKLNDALEYIDSHLPDQLSELYYNLSLRKIHILEAQSNPSAASDLIDHILSDQEELQKYPDIYFHYLLTKATIHITMGRNTSAEQTLDQLSTITTTTEIDPFLMSKYYTVQGNYHLKIGKIIQAITYQREGLEFINSHEGLDDRRMVHWNNLAIILLYQGHFQQALGYLFKALELIQNSTTNIEYETVFIMNIGRTYYFMHDFQLARTYLQDAINKASKVGLYEKIAESLFFVILLETEEKDSFPEAEYRQFMEIPHNNNPRFLLLRKYIKAFKAKSGKRVRDMVNAQERFREIIEDNIFDHQIHSLALLNFAELLFDEMDKFGVNDEIIDDLESMLLDIINLSKQEHLYPIYCRSLVLEAKIKLLHKDAISAVESFIEAMTVARAHGLTHLSKLVSEVYDQSLSIITSLVTGEGKQSIEELYSDLDPQLTVRMMKQFQSDIDTRTDEPILFLIISPGMSLLYSRKFNNSIEADENLIGNFLTAINSFGESIFQTRESIQRIQIGGYNIIFRSYNDYIFSYTFRGPSYSATEKLDAFIHHLIINDGFNQHLVSPSLIINETQFTRIILDIFSN